MSDFVVRWDALAKSDDTFKGMNTTMNNCHSRLRTVKSNLSGMSGYGNVSQTLNTVMNNVEEQAKDIKTIGQAIDAIALLYKMTEQKISGVVRESKNIGVPAGDDTSVDWNDGLWAILSGAGITGKYGSMLNDMFSLDFFGATANGISLFGELLDNANLPEPKDWRSLLFGLGVDDAVGAGLTSIAIGTSSKEAAKAAWKEIMSNYKFGKSAGKNLVVGVQWLTAIVDNGMQNYEEFGTMANARFWGETAIEAGVDVGMGLAATAGFTAAAVALGISAPAVAVAAVAGGVVWAANTICEKITGGRDVGEVIADGVCDLAEKVVDGAKDLADKVGNAFSSAKDAFCGWLGI